MHTKRLRDALHTGLSRRVDDIQLNGHITERLPNTLNISIPGLASDALMASLPDIALSSGSACSSSSVAPSHVLKAMGLTDALAHASLRFGVSRYTSEAEVQYVIEKVGASIERLRGLVTGQPLVAR